MLITNNHRLPEAVIRALQRDPYSKRGADYSVTELIRPPFMERLKRDVWGVLEIDAMTMIQRLRGQIFHGILERAAPEDQIAELRCQIEIDGLTVSGQADAYFPELGLIQDYKDTSVWSEIFEPDGKDEWHKQLNMLAHIFKRNGGHVCRLEVATFFKDWRPTQARRGNGYPMLPFKLYPIPVIEDTETLEYIKHRIALHQAAKAATDICDIPGCDALDRWDRPTSYAIRKAGRKTAVRVLDTLDDAEAYMLSMSEKDFAKCTIEERPGERIRCLDWCDVSEYCPIYHDWLAYREQSQQTATEDLAEKVDEE